MHAQNMHVSLMHSSSVQNKIRVKHELTSLASETKGTVVLILHHLRNAIFTLGKPLLALRKS